MGALAKNVECTPPVIRFTTLIPKGASSRRMTSVRDEAAAFDALYAPAKGSAPTGSEEQEVLFTTIPPRTPPWVVLDSMRRGRNALVTLRSENTLRSNSSRALEISRSIRGMEYPAPALFRSVSIEPPVRVLTWRTLLAMDSSERVSNWIVSMPAAFTIFSFERLRADANTRHPSLWKAMERWAPRLPIRLLAYSSMKMDSREGLPSEHPVMRIVRLMLDTIINSKCG